MTSLLIDVNALTRPSGIESDLKAARRREVRLIILETIVAEQARGVPSGAVVERLRKTFAPLRRVVEQVDFVPGLNVLMQMEFETHRPCMPLVVEEDSARFRRLLREIYSAEGAAQAKLGADLADYAKGLDSRYRHDENKAYALEVSAALRSTMDNVAEFRRGVLNGNRALLVDRLAQIYVLHGWSHALAAGLDVQEPRALPGLRSTAATNLLVSVADRLLWIVDNGEDGRAPQRFSADGHDHHYVVVALLGQFNLRTNDDRMQRILALCQEALRAVDGLTEVPTWEQVVPTLRPWAFTGP